MSSDMPPSKPPHLVATNYFLICLNYEHFPAKITQIFPPNY
jgi:hypothetical protein